MTNDEKRVLEGVKEVSQMKDELIKALDKQVAELQNAIKEKDDLLTVKKDIHSEQVENLSNRILKLELRSDCLKYTKDHLINDLLEMHRSDLS